MGCDIHLHCEIKVDDEWLHYNQPHLKRDYYLFAKLAGVRNENNIVGDPISIDRGIPENASKTTRIDVIYWGCDGHNHGYITADEIVDLVEWMTSNEYPHVNTQEDRILLERNYWGYLFGDTWEGFILYPNERIHKFVQDVRFIFFFDN